MNQKRFVYIALFVIIVSVAGYFVFSKQDSGESPKPIKERNWQGEGTTFLPDEKDHIQVIFPKGGEKLEIGKTYDVQWDNYVDGAESLNIFLQTTTLDNKISIKIIASNVPSNSTGSYKWTVTSESLDNKYKIEIYPSGGRELFGRSKDFFTITGEQLITITSPKPDDRVNLTQPVVITGKARNVFNEGEFDISASYILDNNQKKVVAQTFATCSITGKGCDWVSGNFVDFKSTLNLSSSPICYVTLEFYKRNDKISAIQPFYVLPLWLFGNENCQ